MQYLFDEKAGQSRLVLDSLHLKARRVRENSLLYMRNLRDDTLYTYKVQSIARKAFELVLVDKIVENSRFKPNKALAISVIDISAIEKILPNLNEMGLGKLIFVYAKFSQGCYKLDFTRLKRILINSCEQCGRTHLMEFECFDSVKDFQNAYKQAVMVDFSGESVDFSALKDDELLFIGAEGGFSEDEKVLFERKIRLKSSYILRSQSAILAVAARILL